MPLSFISSISSFQFFIKSLYHKKNDFTTVFLIVQSLQASFLCHTPETPQLPCSLLLPHRLKALFLCRISHVRPCLPHYNQVVMKDLKMSVIVVVHQHPFLHSYYQHFLLCLKQFSLTFSNRIYP